MDVDVPTHTDTFPMEQPHPMTNEYSSDWDLEIDPMGPVGLLIDVVVWNGLAIDKHFTVWQRGRNLSASSRCHTRTLKASFT